MKLSILKKKIIVGCIMSFGISFSVMAQADSASTSKVDTNYAAPIQQQAVINAADTSKGGASAIDAVLDLNSDSTISSALDTMQFDNILNSLDAKTDSVKKVVDAIDKSVTPAGTPTATAPATTPPATTETPAATVVPVQTNNTQPVNNTTPPPVNTETPTQSVGITPVETPVQTSQQATTVPTTPAPVETPAATAEPIRVVGGAPDNNTSSPATTTDGKTSASQGAETGEPATVPTPMTAAPADSTVKPTETTSTATPTRTDSENSPRKKTNTFLGLKKYNRVTVGVHGGATFVGPFGANDFINNKATGAGGLNLTYYLGRAVALQAAFTYNAEMTGDSIKTDLVRYNVINTAQYPQFAARNYKTTSLDYSVSLLFNLGNISFISKKTPKLGLYATAGIGMVSFESKTYDGANNLITTSDKQNRLMIPVGLGVKYKLTNNLTANLGYTMKFVESDKFDNTVTNGNNDKYSYVSVGVSYLLGKKNKPSVEWTNPIAGLYDDLSDSKMRSKLSALQEQLDSLKQNVNNQLDSLKLDDDQDGVPNFLDRQANTPKGAMVDGAGRSIDSDGDGVPDNLDKCPFEKGDPMYDGCKKNLVELSPEAKDILEAASDKLKFKVNSAVIKSGANKSLKKIVDFLNKNGNYKLFIAGHTDSDGPEKLNDNLSLNRAEAVKAFLVRNGIANERIIAKGLGEREPIANNDTPEGKQINRTVVFQVVAY